MQQDKPQLPIRIVVMGVPIAKARPRFRRKTGHTYTKKETRVYESKVRDCALAVMKNLKLETIDKACAVSVVAHVPIPSSWSAKKKLRANLQEILPITKPDGDNYLKSAVDGCSGLIFKDDNLITDWSIKKRYADVPRLEIEVYCV